MHQRVSQFYLFFSFLKIGASAFGGFMALISAVENVFVTRAKHVGHKDMLDGISLASMLPGAVAVNVVAYVGYRLRGLPGVAISVVAVILPSFFLMLVLANIYERWGEMSAIANIFKGFIPAVVAVIVATAWNLARKTIIGWKQFLICLAAIAALNISSNFLVTVGVVAISGLMGLIFFRKKPGDEEQVDVSAEAKRTSTLNSFTPVPLVVLAGLSGGALGQLFLVFASMSLMLFGGGYVFIPLIQEIVVSGYGWLTQKEFVDAIAMGQITPGPILISAAFIGHKVAGVAGATVATAGIFLPSIMLMVFCSTMMEQLKGSKVFQSVLAGIRPAVIGLIAAAAIIVARTAPANMFSVAIFIIALFLLVRFRTPVAAVILPSGFAGWVLYQGAL